MMATFSSSSFKTLLQMKQNEILQLDCRNYDDLDYYTFYDNWHDCDNLSEMDDYRTYFDHKIERKDMGGAYYDDTGNDYFDDEKESDASINSTDEQEIASFEQLRHDDWYDDFIEEEDGSPNVILDLSEPMLQALIKKLDEQDSINFKLRSISQHKRSTEMQRENSKPPTNTSSKREALRNLLKDVKIPFPLQMFFQGMETASQKIYHESIDFFELNNQRTSSPCHSCGLHTDLEKDVKEFCKLTKTFYEVWKDFSHQFSQKEEGENN